MSVFVLDRRKKPLMPCSEKRARKLLAAGRARVHRLYPFTIRLVDRVQEASALQPLRLSIDPGSKATGLALCRVEQRIDAGTGETAEPVLHIASLLELVHRGQAIRDKLQRRAMLRRSRRGRNTRYRAPRFDNRTRPDGWLAPSLLHRVQTTLTWARRLRRLAPVTELAQELVRFDMQLIQAQAEGRTIEGVEYQRKGAQDVRELLRRQPERLKRLLAQAQAPLKDAAAVNATRWRLFSELKAVGLPLHSASGGRTKFNRVRLGLPKTHALDAACVGQVGEVRRTAQPVLQLKCCGRGSRSRTRLDGSGFPRGYLMRAKSVRGFRTGDMVRASVPATSKKAGTCVGRAAVRASGSFNVQTPTGAVQGISHKHCRVIQHGDGYAYQLVAQHRKECGTRGDASHRALSLPGLKAEVSRTS